jgi:DNA-binding NarL/FixJ family response regulator
MKRVLIVDDHELFRQVLAVILEQHTDLKENVLAGSLAEARRVLADLDTKVDLAIIALDLHDRDRINLMEILREVDIPVLALAYDQSLELRAQALRAGADEVLSTANSGEEIVDAAKRLVGE